MAVWLIRAGAHGEYEQRFLQEKRVYVTWGGLDVDLSGMKAKDELTAALEERYPETKPKAVMNWVSQIWPFTHAIKQGDLVVVPLKSQPTVYVGEITGDYHFEPEGPDPFYHWRPVRWIGESVPRDRFGQDLLYSFGAFLTICRISRNDAEARIDAMRKNGWRTERLEDVTRGRKVHVDDAEAGSLGTVDLQQVAEDQVAQLILSRLKGHGLARLVEAILKAQGYTTYRSDEGPDGGIDLLAGDGRLGFGQTRICVQVKSQDTPVESKAITELLGAMQTVGANQGLFVSWGGYRRIQDLRHSKGRHELLQRPPMVPDGASRSFIRVLRPARRGTSGGVTAQADLDSRPPGQ